MRVREIMSENVWTVAPTDTAESAWQLMRTHQVRHLVVPRGDGRLGVLSDRDLGGEHATAIRQGRLVADLMTPTAVTTTADVRVREVANVMRSHRLSCLPVVEGGRLAGIVTVWDLLEVLGGGAARPAVSARHVLKDRGQQPRAQAQAKLTSRAGSRLR